ncbi:MAG: amidohydrolase family protein [Planctomycetaceae bacterium]|nr:amidohydrolase family protein [Planctomycetaceae bacterium]
MPLLELTDLDRRIWDDELDEFVPRQVFDVHTHIYRWAFHTNPDKESGPYRQFVKPGFEDVTYTMLDECDRLLMPGRHVARLSFPFPFSGGCDFERSNEFLAAQLGAHPDSAGLMLVHPGMSGEFVEDAIRRSGLIGLKPYRFFSSTGDAVHCRITDFLPEHQIAVADRFGLLIMMHLSRPDGIGDAQNLDDLERLTEKYPRARWILAHCARSYSSWPIERAGQRLRALPNTWFDTSSVCETDAIAALLRCVGVERVMYGSDDVPVGILRGKYVSFGYGWAYLSEQNHKLNLSHCDSRMTFTRYEQLRAMRRAAHGAGLSSDDVRAMFYDNALQLVHAATTDVRERLVEHPHSKI